MFLLFHVNRVLQYLGYIAYIEYIVTLMNFCLMAIDCAC